MHLEKYVPKLSEVSSQMPRQTVVSIKMKHYK